MPSRARLIADLSHLVGIVGRTRPVGCHSLTGLAFLAVGDSPDRFESFPDLGFATFPGSSEPLAG